MHHANGKPCDCRMTFSDDPEAYAEQHPNARTKDGETTNDVIDEARRAPSRFIGPF